MTGADDYVTKPFSVAELVARVDALYRRLGGSDFDSETLTSGEFRLNLRSRELSRGGQRIELTQVEFMIMKVFLENPGTAISREDLLHKVWGESYQGDLKVVDVNIRRLRLKVEPNAGQPRHILTVWGYGYKWEG
jgi:DNA-binding response OmpR family regulator